MNNEYKIELLNIESVDQQVKVFLSSFDVSRSFEEEKKIWLSKHYHNPNGNSLIFGVWSENMLVSINAFLIVKYFYQGKEYVFLQSCDSGTIESFRGKGLWKKLVTFATGYIKDNYDFYGIIGFPNYTNSYPGFIKMGWTKVFDMKNYILPFNSKAFCKAIDKSCFFQPFIGLFSCFLGKRVQKKYCIEELNDVFDDVTDNNNNLLIDSDFIKWKSDYRNIKTCVFSKNGVFQSVCAFFSKFSQKSWGHIWGHMAPSSNLPS